MLLHWGLNRGKLLWLSTLGRVGWERFFDLLQVIPASSKLWPMRNGTNTLASGCRLLSFPLCRPTMIKYGINNIRELVGHKVNLQMVYNSPICRLESWGSPKPSLEFLRFQVDPPLLYYLVSLEAALHPQVVHWKSKPSSVGLKAWQDRSQ